VQVIIDFVDDAHESLVAELPPKAENAAGKNDKFFHQPKVLKLIEQYEKKYGFTRTGMTSWVGNSVTAYLTPAQIDKISDDKVVRLISENEAAAFSGAPPYYDFNPGTATFSWGTVAVGAHSKVQGSTRRVYVIDSGVATHSNLPSVLSPRKNVACGATNAGLATTGDCGSTSEPGPFGTNYPGVGCYAHATHVTGIIAGVGTTGTTYGVYGGVNVVSVNVNSSKYQYRYGVSSPDGMFSPQNSSVGWCATDGPDTARIGYGLDFAYWDTAYNSGGKVTIVNISINPGRMGWVYNPSSGNWTADNNNPKVRRLATPGAFQNSSGGYSTYPGAFVAQSAGNFQRNSCSNSGGADAYNPPVGYLPFGPPPNWAADLYDGIMVVGALRSDGQAATTFSNSYPPGLQDGGTNYGPCVDIWAPGDGIVSAWGRNDVFWQGVPSSLSQYSANTTVGGSYSGFIPYTSQGWMYLSGTSMAAPHVAGVAAYLADTYNLTTPAAIEAKIRALSKRYNSAVDPMGYPIFTVQSQ
jgi:hypothetical protein